MAEALRVGITGMAVRSGAARTPEQFAAMLRSGRPALRVLAAGEIPGLAAGRVGAPSAPEDLAAALAAFGPAASRVARGASRPLAVSVLVALEALAMARVAQPACAVVVAGSNLAPAASHAAADKFRTQPAYTPVRYGYELFDTHVASAVAEAAALRGPGFSVGAASASGNAGLIVAADAVALARAPCCVVVAPPPGFSAVEWQALDAMGALLPEGGVCRPLDRRGAGFAPADACAAVVIEATAAATARGATVLAEIAGSGMAMDGARGTAPNHEGEARAMRLALGHLPPAELSVISAHATGTPAGDAAECQAIAAVLQGARVPVNAPKSLTGHAIQAAALVELVALLVQMQDGFLHGTAGLEQPLDPALDLLRPGTVQQPVEWALNNAFGFGGIDTSVLLRNGASL